MFLNLLITSISAVATVMGIADEIHPSMAVWSANDSLPLVSTRFSSVTSSAVFSANDFFFTYINTEFRPKIVRVIVSETWTSEEVSNAYISDDPEFKVIDAEEYRNLSGLLIAFSGRRQIWGSWNRSTSSETTLTPALPQAAGTNGSATTTTKAGTCSQCGVRFPAQTDSEPCPWPDTSLA
eukprot:Polyplicarium_translucidae@DN3343_c0_g1_i14.p2